MKKSIILAISILMVSISMQAQTTKEERKKQKMEKAEQAYLATKDLVNSNAFQFVALQATPLGGQMVFMNTNPNYINIDGDLADIYLPYYGVLHAGNGYSAEAGIKFTGELENYVVEFNDEKQNMLITFEIQRGHERHEFNFSTYRGGSTTLTVASSRRNSIVYYGLISELEKPLTN